MAASARYNNNNIEQAMVLQALLMRESRERFELTGSVMKLK